MSLMSQSINLYKQLAKHKIFSKSVNFDLKRIKLILQKLNSPEKKLKNVINIIGSDGKYSLLTSLKYFIEANHQKTSACRVVSRLSQASIPRTGCSGCNRVWEALHQLDLLRRNKQKLATAIKRFLASLKPSFLYSLINWVCIASLTHRKY